MLALLLYICELLDRIPLVTRAFSEVNYAIRRQGLWIQMCIDLQTRDAIYRWKSRAPTRGIHLLDISIPSTICIRYV